MWRRRAGGVVIPRIPATAGSTLLAINRLVIKRLFLAWLILSLLAGATVYLVETRRIDEAVIALAATESQRLSSGGMDTKNINPADLMSRGLGAMESVRKNYVLLERYDSKGIKRLEINNPAFETIKKAMAQHTFSLPRDGAHHYKKLTIAGNTLVQTLVPLKGATGNHVGYLEVFFVINPEDMARLNGDLKRFFLTAFLCVSCTALLLYPIILSLNRSVMAFSDKVTRGNLEVVTVLGAAIAERDSDTSDHNYRVTLYAIRLAEALGSEKVDMRALILGAFLHDAGKIGIRDDILLKPSALTEEELAIMRTHVQLGIAIIQTSEWLQAARDVIEYHHEKYDGSGYLKGLQGEEIPLAARIFAIVDVFDALTSRRPYKEAWPVQEALSLIAKSPGGHFDPHLVAVFLDIAAGLHQQFSQSGEAELNAHLGQLVERNYLRFIAGSEKSIWRRESPASAWGRA